MKTQDVRTYTKQRLRWLQNLPDNQRRAELAKLRRFVLFFPGELHKPGVARPSCAHVRKVVIKIRMED